VVVVDLSQSKHQEEPERAVQNNSQRSGPSFGALARTCSDAACFAALTARGKI
jgi:hypothetical protein